MGTVATVLGWELRSLLANKRYLVLSFVSVIIVGSMIPVFTSIFSELEAESLVPVSPSLHRVAPVGTYKLDENTIIKKEVEKLDKIELIRFKSLGEVVEKVENHEVVGVILIGEKKDGTQMVYLVIDKASPIAAMVEEELTTAISIAAQKIRVETIISAGLDPETTLNPIIIEKKKLGEGQNTGSVGENWREGFRGVLSGLITPLILIIPMFVVGSFVIDSVVGEKERKTLETLLAVPTPWWKLLLGKYLATLLIVSIQVGLILVGISLWGVPVAKPLHTYLMLLVIGGFIPSVTTYVCTISNSYKQASILLTFVNALLFLTLFLPTTFTHLPGLERYASYAPLTIVANYIQNGQTPIGSLVTSVSGLILLTTVFLGASLYIFNHEAATIHNYGPISIHLKILRGEKL
ncbi:MAG: hypothetical protein DRO11_07595 [Methanobacteriota archaeon]|nr:MAG: hypothetical protein DRO11_07595 [Euryarchaeota archaeon]